METPFDHAGVDGVLSSTASPSSFANLARRAEEFVVEHGGCATEDLLIAHVFGTAGSAALWRPLLRSVLAASEELQLRADGSWFSPRHFATPTTAAFGDFVAVDVETTGLQPSRQRLIEIAVVRYVDGQPVDHWESLCNPERKIPAYITKLTKIDNQLVEDEPLFAVVAQAVEERLAGAIVVGHNVEFDLAFINEELKRLGRFPLINERLDLLSLANRLLRDVRRPSLQAISQRLGIVSGTRQRHRAGPDASLTGMVAVELLKYARDAGFNSYDELKALSRSATKRPREHMPRASSIVDRSILATIPRAPGVYLMRDANGHIVYVGKAKNLRDRVSTYFSQPLGYTRKMDGLVESLSSVETEVVGSELEALLLESQLIRRYQPRYNTALRSHEQYPFIRIDISSPWPRISLCKSRKPDGARYFGPFRSASTARKTVDLINRVTPLRTCSRSFRDARSYGSPCLELDLGRCLGPCVGRADRDQYMALVYSVVEYIEGRDSALHEVLWRGLEEAADALDFERASRLRRELNSSLSLTAAQRRLRESTEAPATLLVTTASVSNCREILLVVRGRIWAQLRCSEAETARELGRRLAICWSRYESVGLGEPDHECVDDIAILGSWMTKHEGHPALIPVLDLDPPDWQALAGRVLALEKDELDFDAWRKARDLAEGGEDILQAEESIESFSGPSIADARHQRQSKSAPEMVDRARMSE
jgi:DNA polymerase-3 subunit epsilon